MSFYKQDPNDPTKQIPNVIGSGTARFSYAACPADGAVTKQPSHVIVNTSGTYAFAYEPGGVSTYTTGSVVQSANAGAITLDINPVAWRQTDTAGGVGDVIFVYKRIS